MYYLSIQHLRYQHHLEKHHFRAPSNLSSDMSSTPDISEICFVFEEPESPLLASIVCVLVPRSSGTLGTISFPSASQLSGSCGTMRTGVPCSLFASSSDCIEEYSADSQISDQGSPAYHERDYSPINYPERESPRKKQSWALSHWYNQQWMPLSLSVVSSVVFLRCMGV